MDIMARVHRHPVAGETVPGTTLSYFPGGKGANQAVAAARAGIDVTMVGAVGTDAFGAELVEFLRGNGIDTDSVERVSGPSGTAVIVVDAAGENHIVVVPGANAELRATRVPGPGQVLVAQFETPVQTTTEFFRAGRLVGARSILNPAPAAVIPTELLALVDILVVNETELGVVSGGDVDDQPTIADIRGAQDRLRDSGFAGCLVTTLGARGVVAVVDELVIEVPGRPVEVVDTTGAGDCFVGYLAAGLVRGDDLAEVLEMANIAASLSVQRMGAGPSMPHYRDVAKLA